MSYEIFDRTEYPGRARTSRAPQLTIRPEGRIWLNANAARLLGDAEWVLLLWDREQKLLALQPVDPEDSRSYKVIRKAGFRHATISARVALRDMGVLSSCEPIPVKWDAAESLLMASLDAFEG